MTDRKPFLRGPTSARLLARMAGLLGAALGALAPTAASAQTAQTQPYPAEWVAYGAQVGAAVAEWMLEDSADADLLNTEMTGLLNRTDGPVALRARLTLNAEGEVTQARLDDPRASVEALSAFQNLVEGRLVAPPPADLPMPVWIALKPRPALPADQPAA